MHAMIRSGIDLSQVPPLMDVNDLVDAALIGFDRKETITIGFSCRRQYGLNMHAMIF
jgi:hypothetical protein